MKKVFIKIKIDGEHYKSWYEESDNNEIEINFTSEELLERIVKHFEVNDVILSYLKKVKLKEV